jgi:hypothetical protein
VALVQGGCSWRKYRRDFRARDVVIAADNVLFSITEVPADGGDHRIPQ